MVSHITKLAETTSLILVEFISCLKPGITEKEAVRILKGKSRLKGPGRFSFRPIIASGRRSARPHGPTSKKKIRKGELIVVDIGFKYAGFCSDITRTIVIGKPSPRQNRLYGTVRKAHLAALRKVKAGVRCCEIDKAAREVIKKAGYKKYFTHTTGHGIGRKVHQSPKISAKNRGRLKSGMVITVEPGIYVKGFGGVRIEDMVLVTAGGYKLLTKVPYKLSKVRH